MSCKKNDGCISRVLFQISLHSQTRKNACASLLPTKLYCFQINKSKSSCHPCKDILTFLIKQHIKANISLVIKN